MSFGKSCRAAAERIEHGHHRRISGTRGCATTGKGVVWRCGRRPGDSADPPCRPGRSRILRRHRRRARAGTGNDVWPPGPSASNTRLSPPLMPWRATRNTATRSTPSRCAPSGVGRPMPPAVLMRNGCASMYQGSSSVPVRPSERDARRANSSNRRRQAGRASAPRADLKLRWMRLRRMLHSACLHRRWWPDSSDRTPMRRICGHLRSVKA